MAKGPIQRRREATREFEKAQEAFLRQQEVAATEARGKEAGKTAQERQIARLERQQTDFARSTLLTGRGGVSLASAGGLAPGGVASLEQQIAFRGGAPTSLTALARKRRITRQLRLASPTSPFLSPIPQPAPTSSLTELTRFRRGETATREQIQRVLGG